jgi:hypothetical protein
MAGDDDRDRVRAIGEADRANRFGPADLGCQRTVAHGAAHRDLPPDSHYAADAVLQPSGLKTRWLDGGNFASFAAGRMGRRTNSSPQFGQRPSSRPSAQSRQNVHSNEQITALCESGGRSRSQHSQLGLSVRGKPT